MLRKSMYWTLATASMLYIGSANAGPVLHATLSGDGASAIWGGDVGVCGYIEVARSGTTQSPTTTLWYFINDCATGIYMEVGYGTIPNADLKGSGTGMLSLYTNTSGANFTRDAGAGGQISIDWKQTNEFTTKWTGTQQFTNGGVTNYTYHFEGSGQSSSASLNGTIIGYPVSLSGRYGVSMSSYNNASLVISKGL